jgi:DNA-binding GntR family transcriptional regulator
VPGRSASIGSNYRRQTLGVNGAPGLNSGEAHYAVMSDEAGLVDSEEDGRPRTELVARYLRQQILNGDLRPGQRITQDAVARQLAISRLPVREAIRELATEGLLTIQPNVGARVAKVDTEQLVEVYRMREALEPMVVAEAVRRITPEIVATLRGYLDASEANVREENWTQYNHFDELFHGTLFDLAGMPRVRRVVEGLWTTTHHYRRVYSLLPHTLEVSAVEHRLLLDAIERGAADDAAAIHLMHIRRVRLALSKRIAEEAADTSRASKRRAHRR